MKVSPYRRSSLLLPSAWWACVTLFIQAPGSQVQEPPSAVCVNLQGLGHPFLLGDPWGVFAEAAGQSCSWCGTALPLAWAAIPEGTLSSAQPRDSYWAPRLLPKTCSSEWPGLISAGLVGKNSSSGSTCSGQRGLTAELLGPEGFTRPLPVLSSWGWKSHRGLRGSYPTHSHLNLSAVGQLLGGSSASLGSHHFWNPRCPAGSVPSVAAPPPLPKHVGCAHRVWSQWWALYHFSALDRPQLSGKSADTCTYDVEDMRRQGLSPNCTSQARLNPHASYTRLGLTGTISWY